MYLLNCNVGVATGDTKGNGMNIDPLIKKI